MSCSARPGSTSRRASQPVLTGVDFTVAEGEVIALLGRNGSGKTSLLRCLAGALTPRRGSVQADQPVAYVPQDPNALLFSPTVRRELAETLRLVGRRDNGEIDLLARRARSGVTGRTPSTELSTGERQRVAIAAVAVGDAPVLLLDEPTRGVDAPSRPHSNPRSGPMPSPVGPSSWPPTMSSSRPAVPSGSSCWAAVRSWPRSYP